MAQRTMREMYLDMAKGIEPDYLLQYSYGKNPYSQRPEITAGVTPSFLRGERDKGSGNRDIWGVRYVNNKEAGFAGLPEPGNFILDDITKWRDVIKAPDISDIDWEQLAKKDLGALRARGTDTNETAVAFHLHGGYFQALMAFMGFVEGLCAIQEEPEEVYALFDYLCSFYTKVGEKIIDYIKPDVVQLTDDIAAWAMPFVSPDQYRELIKPFQVREAQLGNDRGLPIAMHCCGKCEVFVEDWVSYGVRYWDPPQTSNDLVAIQKRFGNQIILEGGFDAIGELMSPDCTEAMFKDAVVAAIDKCSKNALFIFNHWLYGDPDNEMFNNRNRWMTEVVEDYGLSVYGNH